MTKTAEKTKPIRRPSGLMDLHLLLMKDLEGTPEDAAVSAFSLHTFADAVVRACDDSAPRMRARVFAAVEALRDA